MIRRCRNLLPRDRTEVVIVFLIALVGSAFYHPGQWSQNSRLAATMAFVEPGTPYTGTFRIDGLQNTPRLRTGDWARYKGRLYSNKAPGVSFLSVVPYFLLYHGERMAGLDPTSVERTNTNSFVLNLCVSVFWNIVAALALLRALPRLGLQSRRGATLVTAMYAFATLVLPYGASLWGHSTTAAFLTLGTLALFERTPRGSALAGWWFGLALTTEYLVAPSIGFAGLLLLIDGRPDRLRHASRFVLGSLLPVGALAIYQQVCFGSFLTTAAGAMDPGMLDPGKFVGQFATPSWSILVQLYLSGHRGLLQHMPILALSVVGIVWGYRTGRRWFVTFAVANILAYSLAISAMSTTWHGGVTTSSRYLIVALPFFSLLLPDLEATRIRGLFVVLFAISAANMFVVAATSTMIVDASPIYGVAYPQFWRGEIAYSPLLTALGAQGFLPGAIIAIAMALGLTWVLRAGLRIPEAAASEAAVTRLSKGVVLISLSGAVAWIVGQTGPSPLVMLTIAAAISGITAGELLPLPGAAIILLLAYFVPAPYDLPWIGALTGLLVRVHTQLTWSYPSRWRPALVLWALTIALGWPLVALRELDFESFGLLSRYAVLNTAAGASPAAVITGIAHAAAVHLLGLLWLDWLFRRFASGSRAEAERWIVWPMAISAMAGCVLAIVHGGAPGFGTIAAPLVAFPVGAIASHAMAGAGIGMVAAPNWWRQSLGELGILGFSAIVGTAVSFGIFLLRARPDTKTRVPAAAASGALLSVAVLSVSTGIGPGVPIAITAGTFAFWLVNLLDSRKTASGGLRPPAWIGVGALLGAFLLATVVTARGDLRVPVRAAQGGWPYAYGVYPASASGANAFRTERHGVMVVPINGPSMVLTVRAEHPDLGGHPVTARVDIDGNTVFTRRLYTSDPIVQRIDLGRTGRAVIETHVDRTWREQTASTDSRDIGLTLSWFFVEK